MSSVSPAAGSERSAGLSDVGRVRGENQDAILADDDAGLWLVADGMGGHAGGARASKIALEAVREYIAQGLSLSGAVMAAHHAVREEQQRDPGYSDMGTTIVAAFERNSSCEICWVGDSRAYSYSMASGRLELLTDDHNVAGMLVAAGALSPSEASRHPQRHVLTDCLGLAGEEEPRIGVVTHDWKPDELLMLCSDGLTGEVSEEEIAQIMESGQGLEETAGQLLETALNAGAHDNVSLVLVQSPVAAETPPQRWKWPFGRRSG